MSRMIPGKRKRERDLKKLSIPSAIRFLDKENCLREADRILAERKIEGMTRQKLSREIYFHAVVFDICMRAGWFGYLMRHADPIDLNDGGDTPFRRLCFDLLWELRRS